MANKPEKLPASLLVDAQVLPEVFLKVVQAKRLLARGRAKNVSEAVRMTELSRSAFYKYKDHVHWYEDQLASAISTYYTALEDEPGVLSSVIGTVYQAGANILTINQNIPVDGVALVTISAQIDHLAMEEEELLAAMQRIRGVVSFKKISSR